MGTELLLLTNIYPFVITFFHIDWYGWPILAIQRSVLQQILLDRVHELHIPIHYDKRLTTITDLPNTETVTCAFSDGSHYSGVFVVGCDGIRSKVRANIFEDTAEPDYTGLGMVMGMSPRPTPLARELYARQGEFTLLHGVGVYCILFSPSGMKKIMYVCVRLCLRTYFATDTQVCWGIVTKEPEDNRSWKKLTYEVSEYIMLERKKL